MLPRLAGDLPKLLARAQKGDAAAQREIGCAHWWGEKGDRSATDCLPKDDQLARHWYTLAAEQGHCQAMYDAAAMYLDGEGGPADVPRALAYLRRAALRRRWDYGADDAAGLLADIYAGGHLGVTADAAQAAYWRRAEADQERKFRGARRRRR